MSSKFSISIFVGCIPYAVGPKEPTAHSAYFCIPSTSFVGPLGRQWLYLEGILKAQLDGILHCVTACPKFRLMPWAKHGEV